MHGSHPDNRALRNVIEMQPIQALKRYHADKELSIGHVRERSDISLKTLHLLRHAKAADRESSESDAERPLSDRGILACQAIAAHLAAISFSVDRVYCSPARRTKETYNLIKDSLGNAAVSFREKLYLISASDLLEMIAEVPEKVSSIMVIGHNPGLHMTALRLTRCAKEGAATDLDAMTRKFPTGALCSLEFEAESWSDVVRDSGTLISFIRPRDVE